MSVTARQKAAKERPRGPHGYFIDKNAPPLLEFKITNPVDYIKLWWRKIMGQEGVDVHFKIHPLTAILIALVLAGAGYGVGRITLPAESPIVKYIPSLGPTASPNPWREKAATGVLRFSTVTQKYYITTSLDEVVAIEAPSSVNLSKLVGKRILVIGNQNTLTGILVVVDVSDLEVLPASPVPVPTFAPTPTPSPTPLAL